MFMEGNTVILNSLSTGKNLRITKQGVVEGLGGGGAWGQLHAVKVVLGFGMD